MRLRVAILLSERDMTAYQLAKQSDGRISLSVAYRLARGEWRALSGTLMDALCDVLDVEPGELFERDRKRAKR